ncbi:MAG: TIM barrel protein [Planctomycetes bacterium]|nr:TIM barrel protein [Planctomycetota bacterium]
MGLSGRRGRALAAEGADLSYTSKGNINHSVCRWCYGRIAFEDLCVAAKSMGIRSIELVGAGSEWDTLKKHGLICAMTPSHGIGKGLNRKENHEACLASIRKAIEATAEAGFPNVICFSGNRIEGMTDEEGLENCAIALKQVVGLAEKKKINLCMELLNSRVDHKGYMCDKSSWGFRLCEKVGSENFKLLYDIYHMQIDEGDIIRTITRNAQHIGHYHTGGVPGRNEIDETQELYYPAIMRAIVKSGYKGYVGQEFIPKRDPLTSLRQGIEICDV